MAAALCYRASPITLPFTVASWLEHYESHDQQAGADLIFFSKGFEKKEMFIWMILKVGELNIGVYRAIIDIFSL